MMASDVDLSDEPVKVIFPLDLDAMPVNCELVQKAHWFIAMKQGPTCCQCGLPQQPPLPRILRFPRADARS